MRGSKEKIKNFWNDILSEQNEYDPFEDVSFPKIEEAIKWLCDNSSSIVDFGCGTGRTLGRCFDYDIDLGCGIDISEEGIKLAQKVMKNYNLTNKSKLICGGINSLKDFNYNKFDGAILFNILDNLKPKDGIKLLKEIKRVLKEKGKLIIKLNQFLPYEILKKQEDMKKISNNFYKEKTGLHLWNISDELLKKLISPNFKIIRKEEIENKKNMKNRLFYLKRD